MPTLCTLLLVWHQLEELHRKYFDPSAPPTLKIEVLRIIYPKEYNSLLEFVSNEGAGRIYVVSFPDRPEIVDEIAELQWATDQRYSRNDIETSSESDEQNSTDKSQNDQNFDSYSMTSTVDSEELTLPHMLNLPLKQFTQKEERSTSMFFADVTLTEDCRLQEQFEKSTSLVS